MDSYITFLTAEDLKENRRGFPFEIEIPVEKNGVSSLKIIEMSLLEGDPIFRFYVKDSPEEGTAKPYPALELVNNLLVSIATTLETERTERLSAPAYLSELTYPENPKPPLGASTTLTTISTRKKGSVPDSFLKVMRIVDGWLICGGGRNHVYREALFAALDNAKSEGILA